MTLVVGAVSHRVGILGPDYVFLEAPGEHPPSEADLILEIDGDREQSRVFLPKGLPQNEREIPIHRIPLK
ncbi:MAG TPA: hypothetical protein VM680_12605 [Verrucomicrobiae bacterium]|nr:hypothetical protein [Verrucomicrobiae bacterium]